MFKKVLVCLDGSAMAEKVIPYAIEQARHFESEIVLFRVIHEPSFISLASAGMERQIQFEQQEAMSYLQVLAAQIRDEEHLPVSCNQTFGVAGPAIVKFAVDNGIELIALATHGRSGPGRAVLGSIADYVIRNAGLPILLIRPTKEK